MSALCSPLVFAAPKWPQQTKLLQLDLLHTEIIWKEKFIEISCDNWLILPCLSSEKDHHSVLYELIFSKPLWTF